MSVFGRHTKIGGLWCSVVLSGTGQYIATFERENATLEQVEAIDWTHPVIEEVDRECVLPKGCGFDVTGITYSSSNHCFNVGLTLKEQYYGDVAWFKAREAELEGTIEAQASDLAAKTAALNDATDLIQGMVDAEVEAAMSQIEG